jgi:hypothetical protein
MQPSSTADSSLNFADPVFLGILAVFAITVLFAAGRWLWLLVGGVGRRNLPRKHVVELVALSIPLAALAVTIAYAVFVFCEAASWSR